MSLVGPNIEKVKAEAIIKLYDEKTEQCIVILAQGNDVSIAVSVGPGTRETWAKALRDIADEIETGEVQDDTLIAPRTLS